MCYRVLRLQRREGWCGLDSWQSMPPDCTAAVVVSGSHTCRRVASLVRPKLSLQAHRFGSVGNTIGPRKAPNPATPALPTPEARGLPSFSPRGTVTFFFGKHLYRLRTPMTAHDPVDPKVPGRLKVMVLCRASDLSPMTCQSVDCRHDLIFRLGTAVWLWVGSDLKLRKPLSSLW